MGRKGCGARSDNHDISVFDILVVFAVRFSYQPFNAVSLAGFVQLSINGDTEFCFHGTSVGVSFEVAHDIDSAKLCHFTFASGVGL